MRKLSLLLVLATASATVGGCGSAVGEACSVQSDCASGLLCQTHICVELATVVDALSYHPGCGPSEEPDVVSGEVALTATAACVDQPYARTVESCREAVGTFESTDGQCLDPWEKFQVSSMTMHATGGMVKMAGVANGVLAAGLAQGNTHTEIWIDGDLAANCTPKLAWFLDPAVDRNADCSPKYTADTFPLQMPVGVAPYPIAVVRNATFDPKTGLLSGVIDPEELVQTLPESIQETGRGLILADVDLDKDGTNESASVELELCFQPIVFCK